MNLYVNGKLQVGGKISLQEVVDDQSWRNVLLKRLFPRGYILLKSRNCWAIWIFTFVKRCLKESITNIESEVTASGYANIMGNKGGVSVRFEVCGVNIIILSCHFTAHKEKTKDRIDDYHDITGHQSFRDEDVNKIMDHDYVFWMGDLNFRLDNIERGQALKMIKSGYYKELFKHDQLDLSRKKGLIFKDFDEGKIDFAPTFKFDKLTDRYDTSKKQRIPAWTDRILYLVHKQFAVDHYLNLIKDNKKLPSSRHVAVRGAPSEAEANFPSTSWKVNPKSCPNLRLLKYKPLTKYKYSDHRPVVGSFLISTPARWFSLPIKFSQPSDGKPWLHNCRHDLTFSYALYNPPQLLKVNEAKQIVRVKRLTKPTTQLTQLLLMTLNVSQQQPEGGQSPPQQVPGGASSSSSDPPSSSQPQHTPPESPNHQPMLSPAVLETGSSDWIELHPAEFADLQGKPFASIRASSSVLRKHDSNKAGDRLSLAQLDKPDDPSRSKYFENTFKSCDLVPFKGQSVIMVYMNAKKRCPQGYSPVIKLF